MPALAAIPIRLAGGWVLSDFSHSPGAPPAPPRRSAARLEEEEEEEEEEENISPPFLLSRLVGHS